MLRAPFCRFMLSTLTAAFVVGGVGLAPRAAEAKRAKLSVTMVTVRLKSKRRRHMRYKIKRSTKRNIKQLTRCFWQVVRKDPKLDGTLYLSARFNRSGDITSRTFQMTVNDKGARACVEGGIKFWTMPRGASGWVNAEVRIRAR